MLKPFLVDENGQSLDNKVLVGFRIGDAIPEIYHAKKRGTDEMEPRVSLKGRLLKLTSAKVNGQVIDLPKTKHDEAKAAEAQADATGGNTGGADEQ